MKFSIFQVSRKGGREKNEDRMGYCYTRDSVLFVLADGMGGHPDGEVAAQLALQSVSAAFQKHAKSTLSDPEEFLANAVLGAHHQILHYAAEKGMLDTPRTTLVACVVQGGKASWVHCGDSRLYLVRDGSLVVRTKDHSFLEQGSTGKFRVDTLNRNILFTCLGSPSRPVFDVVAGMPLQEGDRILLCSDGLWGSLKEADIVHELSRHGVADAVPDLVERALRNGGEKGDNVTAIAMEWETPTHRDSSVSTDSISDGVFASTIQASLHEAMADDELDDAAIERSIAEINEAIRRSAARRA